MFIEPKNKVNREIFEMTFNFPELIADGIKDGSQVESLNLKNIKRIYHIGVGTSGLVGEYVQYYFSNLNANTDFIVIKNHDFPIKEKSLYILYTYSGTTYEVMIALKKILKANLKCIIISSNGVIEEEAKKRNIIFYKMKEGLESRAHLPYGIAFTSTILSEALGYRDKNEEDLKESISILRNIRSKILKEKEEWLKLAKSILENLPMAIGDSALYPVLKRFQNQIAENVKAPALFGILPDMNHNLLVALKRTTNLFTTLIRRNSADNIVKAYYEIVQKTLSDATIMPIDINDDKHCWNTLLYPTYVIDVLSILAGDLKGVDVRAIPEVSNVKKTLAKIYEEI